MVVDTASWIASAQNKDCDFPVQNLPYGVFSTADRSPRCGVAIGDMILDLAVLAERGLLGLQFPTALFLRPTLNAFMALGPSAWKSMRVRLTELLRVGGDPALEKNAALHKQALVSLAEATMHLPVEIGGYTDFYAGRQHAFNSGSILRGPENALLPNWHHLPVAYNGRASTVVVSGEDVQRPLGQFRPKGADMPLFGPSQRLDLELEMGAIVGVPNCDSKPLTVREAWDSIFGFVLLNDWSARDIQAWEGQPLGPFQAKAFRTTISPWIVTRDALEPFRCSTPERKVPLLPYLQEQEDYLFDIALEAWLSTQDDPTEYRFVHTNYRHLYYSAPQLLAHHAVCGCRMCTGDLLGSGTISSPEPEGFACLMEQTWGGRNEIALPSGTTRMFLEDGDTVILRGYAQGDGYRIGFSECRGTIVTAPQEPNWLGTTKQGA